MWSTGRALGLLSDEFWGLTYREFSALLERFREREEREYLRAGIIASTIANCHRDPDVKRDPFTPADFMPGQQEKQGEMPTPEEWLMKARMLNAAFGGEDLTQQTHE